MSRFVEGEDPRQPVLPPSCLDDYVSEDNPARVIDVFVEELDLGGFGFEIVPAATGRRPGDAAQALRLHLNRLQSSRRLEREAQRNVELMWLTGKLAPDHKTIANFRKDNGEAIQTACAHFIVLCRQIGLFTQSLAAVDGSKLAPGRSKGAAGGARPRTDAYVRRRRTPPSRLLDRPLDEPCM